MLFISDYIPLALALAMVVDALWGEPSWLYKRLPHPVVVMGRVIKEFERKSIRPAVAADQLLKRGKTIVLILIASSLVIGGVIQWVCLQLPYGWLLLGLVMSSLIAQRSLAQHVDAVAFSLDLGLEQGQQAVAHIVGRDPEHLDEHGVARAAVESLAENFSDGVVAPVFWGLLFGLPGMLVYKVINTADSMIGHRTEKYLHFGRFAAKLDDKVNWLPARISGFLILAAARFMPGAHFSRSLQAMARDAQHHRSPNAGWPEAAMAGALNFRLAGPRLYDGKMTEDSWIGDGDLDLTARSIELAIRLFWWACGVMFAVVLIFVLIFT